MSHYVYPNTLDHGDEWLQHAACKADPEAMFPDSNEISIANAKDTCSGCPVRTQCLRDALRTGDNEHGIRGGLKPRERRAIAHQLTVEQRNDLHTVAEALDRHLNPPLDAGAVRDLWDERTYTIADGHLGWSGGETPWVQGRVLTPHQVAFFLDRGSLPDGVVRRMCDVNGCVHPRHLTDARERQVRAAAPAEAGAV